MIYSMPKFGGSNLTWTVLGVMVVVASVAGAIIEKIFIGKMKKSKEGV